MPAALTCCILQTHWNKPRCWWAGQREDERTYLHFLGPVCLCSCCLGTDKKLSWPLSRRKGKKGERYMIKGKSSLLYSDLKIRQDFENFQFDQQHTWAHFVQLKFWTATFSDLVAKSWWLQPMHNSWANDLLALYSRWVIILIVVTSGWFLLLRWKNSNQVNCFQTKWKLLKQWRTVCFSICQKGNVFLHDSFPELSMKITLFQRLQFTRG